MVDKYAPREAHHLLGFPMSTLRRYANVYKDYLSEYASLPKRLYTGQDLNCLAYVYEQSSQGLNVDDIKRHLDTMVFDDIYMPPADMPPIDRERTTTTTTALQPTEFFNEMLQRLQEEHDRTITAKNEQIDYLKSEIERLRRPWYKKLFG